MTPIEYLVGLDLSLSSTGICVLPVDWGGDTTNARFATVTGWKTPKTEADRSRKLDALDVRIRDAITDLIPAYGTVAWDPWRPRFGVAIEGLPTRRAYSIVPLAELRGVVRIGLQRDCIPHWVPSLAECRKPIGWHAATQKAIVTETVQSLPGLGEINPDEADAFLAANWLAMELGHEFVAVET